MTSIANELRASAARYPEDWPPQQGVLWDVARAFLGFDEYMGELQEDMPCFLLLVATALDGGVKGLDLAQELVAALEWTARALDKDHPAAVKARAVLEKVCTAGVKEVDRG